MFYLRISFILSISLLRYFITLFEYCVYVILLRSLKQVLFNNIDKVHTTEMGIDRIKKNLKLDTDDVVEYCKNILLTGLAMMTQL